MSSATLDLIQAIRGSNGDSLTVGLLVEDCRELLSLLQNSSINFILREANGVAHRLARFALSLEEASAWFWDPP